MSTFHWSDRLSVHNQELDTQHRHLFTLIGELDKVMTLGTDRESLDRVIRELNVYVREHFTAEERLMQRHGYPALAQHAAQHEAFMDKLLHLELDHLGGRVDISRELLDYLENWLTEHVGGFDLAYAAYFRETGAY
jgi:hemerythrin